MHPLGTPGLGGGWPVVMDEWSDIYHLPLFAAAFAIGDSFVILKNNYSLHQKFLLLNVF